MFTVVCFLFYLILFNQSNRPRRYELLLAESRTIQKYWSLLKVLTLMCYYIFIYISCSLFWRRFGISFFFFFFFFHKSIQQLSSWALYNFWQHREKKSNELSSYSIIFIIHINTYLVRTTFFFCLLTIVMQNEKKIECFALKYFINLQRNKNDLANVREKQQ